MKRGCNWLVGAGLFLVTMALYWPATHFQFVYFDDPWYVYQNAEVMKGLSWSGIKWAATCVEPSNWAPLTLVSHMTDCSVYGLFPGGHHLTSILVHSVNAVLLFLLLGRITKMFWPSALVAALFAWHPLNVESVAWVAERKNVLSTSFCFLTIWAYWSYAEISRPAKYFYYALALAFFALGLAAKSMLVTLPFLLLLLDAWPLRRISFPQRWVGLLRQKQTWRLLAEKIPFLVFAVADGIITYLVQNQSGAVKPLSLVPVEYRLLNAPVAYLTYLAKLVWPVNLCVYYPFPDTLPTVAGISSLVLLVAVTFMVWRWKTKFPWLLVGWLWFLVALAPVIGLVQIGGQAMADRYAYLPLIGVFLIIACGLNECLIVRRQLRHLIVAAAVVYLGICLILTGRQLRCWQDSVTLFEQEVAVNPDNDTAQDMLGSAYANVGESAKAIDHFIVAVRLHPGVAPLQYDLGRELIRAGRFAEAEKFLAEALAQAPDNGLLHNTRGVALMLAGKTAGAKLEFSRAIELQPDLANAYFNLGKTLLAEGQSQLAITNFITALKLEPVWPEALENLASAYAASGNPADAVATAGRALKIAQTNQQAALADRIAAKLKTYQNAETPQSSSPPKN